MDHIINAVTTEDLAGFAIFLFIRRRFFSTGDLKHSGKHYKQQPHDNHSFHVSKFIGLSNLDNPKMRPKKRDSFTLWGEF